MMTTFPRLTSIQLPIQFFLVMVTIVEMTSEHGIATRSLLSTSVMETAEEHELSTSFVSTPSKNYMDDTYVSVSDGRDVLDLTKSDMMTYTRFTPTLEASADSDTGQKVDAQSLQLSYDTVSPTPSTDFVTSELMTSSDGCVICTSVSPSAILNTEPLTHSAGSMWEITSSVTPSIWMTVSSSPSSVLSSSSSLSSPPTVLVDNDVSDDDGGDMTSSPSPPSLSLTTPAADGQLTNLPTSTPSAVELLARYSDFPQPVLYSLLGVFVMTMVSNAVLCVALYRTRRLKPALRVLLFNLALSDALAGLVNVYHMIVARLVKNFSVECLFRYGLVIQLVTVTLMSILMLSADRVFSLVATLHYERLVTERRLWVCSALNWLVSLVFPVTGLWNAKGDIHYCIFLLMIPKNIFYFFGVSSLIIIAIIVGLNLYILVKTFRHINRIGQTVVGAEREARVAAMNQKAMVTSLVVILPFLLLNTPLYLLFLVLATMQQLTETLSGLIAVSVCLGLIVTNSLINPIIYVWRSHEVRVEVTKAICFGKCAGQHRSSFSS